MGACHIIKEKDEQLSYGRGRHTSGLQEEWETESWWQLDLCISLTPMGIGFTFFPQRTLNSNTWQKTWLSLAHKSHIPSLTGRDPVALPLMITEVLEKNMEWIRFCFGPTWIRCPIHLAQAGVLFHRNTWWRRMVWWKNKCLPYQDIVHGRIQELKIICRTGIILLYTFKFIFYAEQFSVRQV